MTIAEPKARWDAFSRQVRSNMGLGRDKFARLLQVSPRTVMRWENGQDGETVVPQSVQRMKLLALSLSPEEIDRQQDVLADLLTQASDLRSRYEQKATTIREYGLRLEPPLPSWFRDLNRLRKERNWSALALMGPHFLAHPQGNGAERQPLMESLVCLWVGNAAFMLGDPHKALLFYERALTAGAPPAVLHCVLLSNKGYALMRTHDYEAAGEAFEESLRLDPAHRGALRNRLALFSLTEDEAGALRASTALLKQHPEGDDPHSELGRLLLEDPDLKLFRQTETFARAFPGLAKGNGRKP
jgi:tetratricopeptide (TPR) repeat protein